MSFMLEKKAREIFALYQQAELSGKNDQAEALENQLNDAGWRITQTTQGETIVRDGLFANWGNSQATDSDLLIPRDTSTPSYKGTSNTGSRVWLYVGIGVGVLVLSIIVIIAVKRIKKSKNGGLKEI